MYIDLSCHIIALGRRLPNLKFGLGQHNLSPLPFFWVVYVRFGATFIEFLIDLKA
jgi:hypothetical protein